MLKGGLEAEEGGVDVPMKKLAGIGAKGKADTKGKASPKLIAEAKGKNSQKKAKATGKGSPKAKSKANGKAKAEATFNAGETTVLRRCRAFRWANGDDTPASQSVQRGARGGETPASQSVDYHTHFMIRSMLGFRFGTVSKLASERVYGTPVQVVMKKVGSSRFRN